MQDPGFRTSHYYFNFGQALICPLFSAFHSFADGIDPPCGETVLTSAMIHLWPVYPGNHALMNAIYLLTFGLSVPVLAGFAVALVRFIRQPDPEWLLVSD